MKYLVLLLVFSISCFTQAQDIKSYYFGLGVNASYSPFRGLNNVIRHYQNSRFFNNPADNPEEETWVSNLSEVNILVGPSISAGYLINPSLNLEFRYMDRQNSRTSRVVNTDGAILIRSFDVSSRSYGLGVSRLFTIGKSDYIIGSTLNATRLKIDASGLTLNQPINQTQFGTTLFIKYIFNFSEKSPFAIVINPFFQYHFIPIDFFQFNKVMNPKTYTLLSSSDLQGARSYFGLEIQINYFVLTGFNKEKI